MKTRIAVLLVAGVLGCTSTGDPGPQGIAGPPGPTGQKGDAGSTGVSVTSLALSVGSLDCPNGGSQFASSNNVTNACSGNPGAKGDQGSQGAQGIQGVQGDQGVAGPPGPAAGLTATAADGTLLGFVYGIRSTLWNQASSTGAWADQIHVAGGSRHTYLLLAEQPGGIGTEKVLVWRNALDGRAFKCVRPDVMNGPTPWFATGDATPYTLAADVPPPGIACASVVDGVPSRLYVARGVARNVTTPSFDVYFAVPFYDIGPATGPAAPLRVVVP